ncbi:aldo/keto reductase [Tatumella sp. UBA2305]|uniref:aldo/keto reductase n=1 Tax=Tatumella sp. UBA2305 TaxID=1947647 RepID=UPI0025D35F5B|nr:aldo/keto reductase [Tatumella sp. UBA2305]
MKSLKIDGQTLPAIGMGSWRLGQGRYPEAEEVAALNYGLSHGLKVIDTAEMYGDGDSEILIGKALKNQREKAWLVSKVYPWNASVSGMKAACEQSLQRLQTDYLDLYLLHWASEYPLEEIVDGFQQLQQQGKIKAWGVSNFDTRAMKQLWQTPGGQECCVNQIFYNPQARGTEFSLLPWCAEHGVAVMAYSPLGGHEGGLLNHPLIRQLAKKYQCGSSAIVLSWAIRDGNVLAIPESGSENHIAANLEALTLELSDEDLLEIDKHFAPPAREQPLEIR